MSIATWELLIPGTIEEIERRANRAHHGLPARPARWSPARWLRALSRDATTLPIA